MTEETKLLPCPFCGGEAKRLEIEAGDEVANVGGGVIECMKCHASSPVHFERKENLVSSWNTRALSLPKPAWLLKRARRAAIDLHEAILGASATDDLDQVLREGAEAIDELIAALSLQDQTDLAANNDRLSEALKSQIEQTWKESDRADKADHMRVAIETGKVHPALAIDVSEHRQQAYQTGWNDGYAEGFGKAKSEAKS